MICQTCHGERFARCTTVEPVGYGRTALYYRGLIPCPECEGSGVAHCCEGMTACNDVPALIPE